MSNSNKENKLLNSDIDSKKIVVVIGFIVLIIVGFYFYNFHNGLSKDNGVWGTFGDYVGGILNPVIAAFAFYLIAKTYELQKTELEATRCLLEASTNAQKEQIKLAALTALLNSNLTRISILESEKIAVDQSRPPPQSRNFRGSSSMSSDEYDRIKAGHDFANEKIEEIRNKINCLVDKNKNIEERIEDFLERNH
jgi:large-conductance mechanosensitive channel